MSESENALIARLGTEEAIESGDIIAIEFEYIANHLEVARFRLCPYPKKSTCDCKYGLGYGVSVKTSEKTGCPELREIIAVYRAAARGFPI